MKYGLAANRIDRDGYYTLWQKIGQHWVLERSFRGGYILDTMMDAIESSWVSSRPYGVFPRGTDPNRNPYIKPHRHRGRKRNPPYSGYRKGWTRKKLPKDIYKACYRTKTDALNVFLTFNSDVVEDYGGPSYVHSPESFEAINHLYELMGKRRVDSIAKAVWWALPGPGPWCLEDINLDLLNQTAPVIYNEYGYEFRLPDHLEEARLIAQEDEWYSGVEYPEHEEVPF